VVPGFLATWAGVQQAVTTSVILASVTLLTLLLTASGCAHGIKAFRQAISRFEGQS
jgi:hypothetical protein